MTAAALPTVPVLHSEWIKIRTARSSLGSLMAVLVTTVGITALTAAAIGTGEEGALGDDPLLAAFYGVNFGQIAAIAFGATALAGEFRHGALRISLTAVPDRTRLYLSKVAVVACLALLVGEVTGLLTFVAGQALMGPHAVELGDPGTVRAVFGSGVYLMLMALLAAGLTALVRSGTLVMGLLIPFVLIVPFVVGKVVGGAGRFMPDRAGQAVMRLNAEGSLGPWEGLAVTALWSVAALVAGWIAMRRRDA
ncbi:ABC transporter [Streptomyces subrutilus]|uniref:ABC transporter n=1 Tax=Streptomyces subrutilus TaxID=36818 RepID=A0A5P2UR72_9ACTN|nr:ABC transporter permease [Streptomyces subrutilus]QEU81658.1 ABC transporter permease [Streptomyces subrutilus]GGZ80903.1 ABC transporter [Streptomyces subrutilus]